MNSEKIIPFGWRVLVEIDPNNIFNIGAKTREGRIVGMPNKPKWMLQEDKDTNCGKNIQEILYSTSFDSLNLGTVVVFKYDINIIDVVSDNIYSIPIDLIRGYYEG